MSRVVEDAAPVLILTMKWGTLYGPEYVNRLYAGVAQHLQRRFRFICFTDDGAGLHSDVEVYPLPQMQLPDSEEDLRWRKLLVFQRTLFDLAGTALFLDLDVVIVGSLDVFFERDGAFHIIRDDHLAPPKPLRWLNPVRAQRVVRIGNSSVFRFEIGAHAEVLDDFIADPQRHIDDQPNAREQEYLTEALHHKGELRYWPRGWCVAFKYHCVPGFPANLLAAPALPPGARIIIFAGGLKIPEAIAGNWSRWYRRIRPSPWLAALWRDPA